jgi:hypothetical protein
MKQFVNIFVECVDKAVYNLAIGRKIVKKFTFFIILFIFFGAQAANASDQFGRFQEFITRDSLKPFTKDLGSLLGAATFHNGRSLGLSGFDIGVRGGMQFQPEKGNAVLRNSGVAAFGLPWVQGEIGLPFSFDGYIRGISFQGLTIAGGGLRYGLTKKTDKPWKPQFLLSLSAHSVTHTHFSASHFGSNLVASMEKGKVRFFLGGGIDRTRVVVRSEPALDATLTGERASVLEPRGTLGLAWRPKPYLYVHAAYTWTHGQSGLDSGVGIRF